MSMDAVNDVSKQHSSPTQEEQNISTVGEPVFRLASHLFEMYLWVPVPQP